MSLTKVTNSMIVGAVTNVLDYGATGDGVTDDYAAIQAAIDATPTGGQVVFPPGQYQISDQLEISNKNSITLSGYGGNSTPAIRWIGGAESSKAIIRIYRSSYCTVQNLLLHCLQTNKPGFGVRITSVGAGVTQGNTIKNCTINFASEFGIYIGDSNNLDQSVDLNTIENCFIDFCGRGAITIQGANTNQTRITRGSYAIGSFCGIEVGTFARGVYISDVLPFDTADNNTAVSWLYVGNKFSGLIEVSNIVAELFRRMFLYAESSTIPQIATGQIIIRNFISTCNFAETGSAQDKIIEFLQHGLLKLENCYIAGRSDAVATYISYDTPDNPGPGLRTLDVSNVLLYPTNMQFNVPSTANSSGAETTWVGNYRTAAGPAITSGSITNVRLNANNSLVTSLSAIPTGGTWQTGAVIFNSAPASGQPMGWMCSSGGVPGSWLPMPNLP
jgi:hypothetical protein